MDRSDSLYDFTLDAFQVQAIEHLRAHRSVLVAAPTGAGKTVVADHAVADALAAGRRAFYTTPIKALSNQKFRDLAERHGSDQVGLLTGDNSINGDAPVVVMTTEVLRNMIYAGTGGLARLDVVILDEVHYLEDHYRGPVWEEVIIHLPAPVRLVCLSATVSNAEDLADWIATVRGPTEVVIERRRPVELVHLYGIGDRTSERLHLIPTLISGRPNPEGFRFDADDRGRRGTRPRQRRLFHTPHRLDVLDRLREQDMLPAIHFIFSRRGCDDAVASVVAAGERLVGRTERARIRAMVEERTSGIDPADLAVLGYDSWLAGLEMGVAAHHAGMIPTFKEAVEDLFAAGLVKLVYATETLALGINMPARTVVVERLTKFTGDHHQFLTPGQYTQLTGRAGRRGIDELGHAVVLWSPFVTFQQVADLAASRSFELRSAFRPTYNMAANLIRRCTHDEAHRLLNLSFGQYQSDQAVVRLQQRLARRREEAAAMATELGARREDLVAHRDAERAREPAGTVPRDAIEDAVGRLRPGDVLALAEGPARCAVLSVAHRRSGGVRIRAVTPDGTVRILGAADLVDTPEVIGTVELPRPFAPKDRGFQREVAARLRRARVAPPHRSGRRRSASRSRRGGPQLRALERLERAEREITELERRIRTRSETLARRFDDVVDVLTELGYVDRWRLTAPGRQLVRIYHECDLAIAEALREGVFDGLEPASVAGLVSCFTYEHRSPVAAPAPWFPSAEVRRRFERLVTIAQRLNRLEAAHRLALTRPPDPTFFPLAHAWASGDFLEHVLGDEEEVSSGDFVRNIRQLDDLLRQLGDAAVDPATASATRRASGALQRGIVAASNRVDVPGAGVDGPEGDR